MLDMFRRWPASVVCYPWCLDVLTRIARISCGVKARLSDRDRGKIREEHT